MCRWPRPSRHRRLWRFPPPRLQGRRHPLPHQPPLPAHRRSRPSPSSLIPPQLLLTTCRPQQLHLPRSYRHLLPQTRSICRPDPRHSVVATWGNAAGGHGLAAGGASSRLSMPCKRRVRVQPSTGGQSVPPGIATKDNLHYHSPDAAPHDLCQSASLVPVACALSQGTAHASPWVDGVRGGPTSNVGGEQYG